MEYPSQMFAVISWGACGTLWLSKAFNSHPSIMCLHGLNNELLTTRATTKRLDGEKYMDLVRRAGEGYQLAGDVHGVSRHTVPEISAAFPGQVEFAILVRSPIPRLHSQWALFREYLNHRLFDLSYIDPICRERGIRLRADDYESRLFVHGANMLNAIVDEQKVGTIYRCEDLFTDAAKLEAMLDELSQGTIDARGGWAAEAVRAGPVNRHSTLMTKVAFDEWQWDAIKRAVLPEAWDIYESLGYDVRVEPMDNGVGL